MSEIINFDVINSNRRINKKRNNQILNDFFQMILFNANDVLEGDNKDEFLEQFNLVLQLLKNKLAYEYEKEILKSDPINYRKLLSENSKTITDFKRELTSIESTDHSSFVDLYREKELSYYVGLCDSNVIYNSIYNSKLLSILTNNRIELLKLFNMFLEKNGLYTGNNQSETIHYVNAYYDVLSSKKLQDEFIDVLNMKKKLFDSSEQIRLIFSLPNDYFNNFKKYLLSRNYGIESIINMYLVIYNIFDFDSKMIEEHMEEDDLDSLMYTATCHVESNKEEMYLKHKLITESNK